MPLIRSRLKTILIAFTITLTLSIIYSANAFTNYEKDLEERLKSKKFLNPTIFYAAPIALKKGYVLPKEELAQYFARQNFRTRINGQRILYGDFFWGNSIECRAMIPEVELQYESCLLFAKKQVLTSTDTEAEIQVYQVFMMADFRILEIRINGRPESIPGVELDPEILAQYLNSEPIMQEPVEIKDLPTNCPNAIMAIEDAQFLEHKGYSIKGTLRGVLAPLLKGKKPQGGSTITQQLVKNYFLTNERSVRRKAEELIMSMLIEKKMTKDEILETYMNIIYMGQNGPFQIIGFGSASQFYFSKKVSDLHLEECALLAAILNGPGVYNPFTKVEKTLARRNLVLSKMQELKLISDAEFAAASAKPLMSQRRPSLASETAPFYLDAVRKQLKKLNIPAEGARIQTGLNLELQQKAQESLQTHLANLEKENKKLAENKKKGLSLEGVVISTEQQTGIVDVLVGGRSFRMTQFNRALDGHRQVGSIFKPMVYLTALQNIKTEEGFVEASGLGKLFGSHRPFSPLTPIKDESFVWTMNKRKWSPENYAKKFFGPVPMYYALKNSLNASTALLGQTVGLDGIIDTAKKLGAYSELKPFPSLTLGAFEMYPIEALQIYSTLANLGKKVNLSFIKRVYNFKGEMIYEYVPTPESVFDEVTTSVLIGILKQNPISGTAKSLANSGIDIPIAGKTGTTNDYKDTWFIGMTPMKTALVWVGYDQNGVTGLTGGSGAVPVWGQFMKSALRDHPKIDFAFPEDKINRVIIDKEKLTKMGLNIDLEPELAPFELIFDKEKTPSEVN